MAKRNIIRTSAKAASAASKVMRSASSGKAAKTAAGAALVNRKAKTR